MSRRLAIRRTTGIVRWLLCLFGGTQQGSYVEIEASDLHIRYGWVFDRRIRFDEIESMVLSDWPWYSASAGVTTWRAALA